MRDDYTSPDQSNAITLDEFMVYVGMGDRMNHAAIEKHLTRRKGGGTMVSKAAPTKPVAKGKIVKKK